MIRYEIDGGNLPIVTCYPEAGQTMYSEAGAMCWMSPNFAIQTVSGGFDSAFNRMLAGESLYLNEYTTVGGPGMIAFASRFPGSILPLYITPERGGIIVQKRSFLAMEQGLMMNIHFQRNLGIGFFGGEGFIMQRVAGTGMLFLEIDGFCKEIELAPGQSLIVDTGNLAAMSETCAIDILEIPGATNIFFGGHGLFHTRVTGPGRVWLQSMPISSTAQAISPYIPRRSD